MQMDTEEVTTSSCSSGIMVATVIKQIFALSIECDIIGHTFSLRNGCVYICEYLKFSLCLKETQLPSEESGPKKSVSMGTFRATNNFDSATIPQTHHLTHNIALQNNNAGNNRTIFRSRNGYKL